MTGGFEDDGGSSSEVNSTEESSAEESSSEESSTEESTAEESTVVEEVEEESVIPTTLRVGQRNVSFGDYKWRVLDIQDGKALLLSEEIIEQSIYYPEWANITWEDSYIRRYLNSSFLLSFTQEEKDDIVEVTNINNDNQWFEIEGGSDTQDKVFLLSIEEVVAYFGDSGQLKDRPEGIKYISDQYSQARLAKYGNEWSWWWLRSPGGGNNSAVGVYSNGDIYMDGRGVHYEFGGVRPALWLDVSDIDTENTSLFADLTVGQRDVVFGNYTWRVLAIQDGMALLLSEEIIEKKSFENIERIDVTWEDCTLRDYLNGPFLRIFTQEQQDAIAEVYNLNDDNQWFGIEGGNPTFDKIFLLSIEEVVSYLGDSGKLSNGPSEDEWGFDDQYNEERQEKNGNDLAWWWLRSPGRDSFRTACVGGGGTLIVGGDRFSNADGGVRPALWVYR